jgi:hypothetical protein
VNDAIDIRDPEGNPANNRFGIAAPDLTGIADISGAGGVGPGGNASARWLIVPNDLAAPTTPLVYSFGGTLTYIAGGSTLKRYRVGLGDPEGAKQRQGDRRTPEGKLRIVTRNATSNFHRFLGISYPTAADADRGLRQGLVTRAQADAIRAAEAAGRVPPWTTALGGTVGIHGGGGEVDWTLGCVAVTDAEIDELFEVVRVGTPLEVLP